MDIIHSGDYGDIVYFIPVLRQLPEGRHTLYLADRHYTNFIESRAGGIVPLLELVGIDVKVGEPPGNSKSVFDASTFRRFHRREATLIEAQWDHAVDVLGLPKKAVDTSPWIHLDTTPDPDGAVVVARSPRYNNPLFPWAGLRRHYKDVPWKFVGTEQEYASFCLHVPDVDYLPTKDLSEVAHAVAKAPLFIGNQSSPLAVALGLGGPVISEVCPWQPDCILPRDNVFYGLEVVKTPDGGVVGGVTNLDDIVPVDVVPPGGWVFMIDGVIHKSYSLQHLSLISKTSPLEIRRWMVSSGRVNPKEKWLKKYNLVKHAFSNAGLDMFDSYPIIPT
jgi:hypothetical protein